ncbi:hypothetical protein [Stygiolobus caldivivus]|uniref:hypothetical protein n=1 Tax=Stygiolobus caldivivus TaxID=2824673 RepID=UPI001C84617F|nr:hypothetical protein [Stygiolobus caldivivus]
MEAISKEEIIKQSREISLRVYYTVILNSSKVILDFVGLSSLITFLLVNLVQTPFTLNVGILAFSTIYVIVSLKVTRQIVPLVQAINENSIISRKYPLLVKLSSVLSLLTLYTIFLLSFFYHSLSILPAILVGVYLSFNAFQLIEIVKFLKTNRVEYLLVVAYVISGIAVILSPFKPLLLLTPPTMAFLYRLMRGAEKWR